MIKLVQNPKVLYWCFYCTKTIVSNRKRAKIIKQAFGMNYPAASRRGITQTAKFGGAVVRSVRSPVFDVVGNHVEIAVLADGIRVVALGPEIATPELVLYFGMGFENMPCGDAFDLFDGL